MEVFYPLVPGRQANQSAGPSTSQSTPASGVPFAMPPGFLDTSSGPGGGPGGVPVGVPVSQDPLMMQVLRQQFQQHPCQTGSLGVQGQKSCLVSRVS